MATSDTPSDFIRNIIRDDLKSGKHKAIVTRFPPEPNGFLHIGHAKAICLNFGVAEETKGSCNLRFDDTNPDKEESAYIEAIEKDVRWLGFSWGENRFHASDYFEQLYGFAEELIGAGKAYVDELSAEQTREHRGTLTEPGKPSPFRDRPIEENLDLFKRMRAGEFADGSNVLRAKIDMAAPNMNMRDPTIYRIRTTVHHQTGDTWRIYPMYDFTHPISDALEGITHSLCTLEFEDHRPLYDWVLDNISAPCHPRQIEFSRLNLEFTVMSKRKLNKLVSEKLVNGWDDPRMPTIAGLRNRGYTPTAIRNFCSRIGVTKVDTTIEMGVLENCLREDLDRNAPRAMGVLHPLKVTLSNYPENQAEELTAACHPQNADMGSRTLPFSQTLYIDSNDFLEVAPNKKFKRLVSGGEVRLRNAYVIKCDEVIKNADDEIIELVCSYDPATLGANPEGRKIKGVIHWVSATQSVPAEIRLYDRLFTEANPGDDRDGRDFHEKINSDSLKILPNCRVEASLAKAKQGDTFQFEREGYFRVDSNNDGKLVVNRAVTLRDTWAKIVQQPN